MVDLQIVINSDLICNDFAKLYYIFLSTLTIVLDNLLVNICITSNDLVDINGNMLLVNFPPSNSLSVKG
jgi:hypothetical protein